MTQHDSIPCGFVLRVKRQPLPIPNFLLDSQKRRFRGAYCVCRRGRRSMFCRDGDDGCSLGSVKEATVEESSESLADKMECRLRHRGPFSLRARHV